MTAKRVGAALAAVVLIVGAYLLRRNVIDDSVDTDTTTASVADSVPAPSPALEVVCITELAAACAAIGAAHPELSVTIEPAGTTLDRLALLADGAEAPVWLTVAPFPAMLDSLRASAGSAPLDATPAPIAASRLAIATPSGTRADVLAAACAPTPLWRCIGDSTGTPWTELGGEAGWGTVRPSLGLVDEEAMALASFAAAVAGYSGTPDVTSGGFGDPAFTAWYRRLARASASAALSAGTPLATMATRPALDIAATSDAERTELGAPAERFDASYPEPSMWLEAVLAVPDGAAVPEDVATVAADALGAAGWDDASAATQSLPGPSTMLALRAIWQEAT